MRCVVLALALAGLPAVAGAQLQWQQGSFHDCISVTTANYVITASADGVPIRLTVDASKNSLLYPARAIRMKQSDADVVLSCTVVSDRPLNCAVVQDPKPQFSFGAAAVRVAESGRLSGPAGIWPAEIVVSFRRVPLAHPITEYC